MRKIIIALAIGLLATAGGSTVAIQPAAASVAQIKVVLVVGATGSATASYRADADAAAAVFAKYTSNIVKVYSPSATWPAVQTAAQGASVLVYLGHGSGYPNPYVGYLQPNSDNGMGLNATAGNGDSNTKYYGENYMAQLNLALNAVVLLNHLCYASGDNEWGTGLPALSTAQTRVDGYASGFLRGNARAVIAEGLSNLGPYIDAIFSAHETIDQMWKSYPSFHNHVTSWPSTRNTGYTSQIDPDIDHPAADGDYYYRSLVTWPGLTTDTVRTIAPTPTYGPSTYHALTPARILDSRNGTGGLSGKFLPYVARTFQVTGAGGVPAGAIAVTGNLTVTQQTGGGFLFAGPAATNNPGSSTLNFPVGDDRANEATVALGGGGTASVTYVSSVPGATADVIFDVTGYFTPDTSGATYVPLSPARILDSRAGTGGLSGKFSTYSARTFQVTGAGGVPAGAIAVTGNLTVTQQTGGGYLFMGPAAMNNPTSSTLNFPVGDDRANAVAVALGTGGKLSVTYVSGAGGATAHVIFDVTGYFVPDMTGAMYVPLSPARILDSRNGTGGLPGKFSSYVARTFQVTGAGGVPAGAVAVIGNLTVTQQTGGGFLYAGPAAMNNPTSSTLNFPVGDDRANAVAVALGSGGTLSVTYVSGAGGATAHAIFDVTGYFAAPSA
jgi:hypothetical protein